MSINNNSGRIGGLFSSISLRIDMYIAETTLAEFNSIISAAMIKIGAKERI